MSSMPNAVFSSTKLSPLIGLIGLVSLLILLCFLHLGLGAKDVPWSSVWLALQFDDINNAEQNVVNTIRLPRLYIALIAGSALGLAGIVMQVVSHNPLADPGLLGVNSGAAFFVVVGTIFFSAGHYLPFYAFFGACFSALLVFFIAGKGNNFERLILSGVAITAFFSALTAIVLLVDQQGLDKLRHWLTGSIGARDIKKLSWVWPYLLVGASASIILIKSLNAYHLGDRVATSLGVNVQYLKIASLIVIVLLSGSIVALVGPIGFVGLVVPHIARFLVGNDFRWLLPYTFIIGAMLMVGADLSARVIVRPYEINTGIITAIVGAPVFIVLVLSRLR